MAHDEYNSGIRRGYNNALRILRKVDGDIAYPRIGNSKEEQIKYNTKKDLIYKIYGLIKEDMEECTNE